MITEDLLQFIWQYSLYHPANLKTTTGESVTIIHPGKLNRNAGPDFEEAKIKINKTVLVGNVELHIHASDWKKHKHQYDKAYQSIILHVVYEDDSQDDSHSFSKLVLKPHIPDYVLERYTHLLHTATHIPCSSQLTAVNDLIKENLLGRMLAERWEQKLEDWKMLLQQSAGNWQNLLYWRLAANFGFKVNTAPFVKLAQSIPLNLFAKHKESLLQTEALLFGQAGFLENDTDEEYPKQLQTEYAFMKAKYRLSPLEKHHWKFLRLRPANFPTIRIAQFAALIHQSVHLFSHIIESKTADELRKLLNVIASSYWDNHYRFGETHTKPMKKKLGTSSVDNILINTIAPLQFLFAYQQGDLQKQEDALQLLANVPSEKNNIISVWDAHGWPAENAAQSQGLIQLYNYYCSKKRCLECAVGLGIIKKGSNV